MTRGRRPTPPATGADESSSRGSDCGQRMTGTPDSVDAVDMKLELVTVPVTDVDRARDFYVGAGFVLDHDKTVSDELRFVQLTPPVSACSIAIGTGLTKMQPGSLDNLQMVVADADAIHAELVERGVPVSEVDDQPWGRFVYFQDPDGNGWALQQLPAWSTGAGGSGENPYVVGG